MRPVAAVIAVLLFTLMCPLALAQHRRTDPGERKPETTGHEEFAPPLKYIVQADVLPDSALIRGQVDIQYRNVTSDAISQFYIDLGRNSYPAGMEIDFYSTGSGGIPARGRANVACAYTIVDSISYRATRIEKRPLMETDSIMQIELPVSIEPGETGQLLVVFETRLTSEGRLPVTMRDWYVARSWFPRLVAYDAVCGGGQTTKRSTINFGPASYGVALRVDSSYTLIAPGELLNEKLHYGTFEESDRDTIFTDVLSHMFAFSRDRSYVPTWESGIKKYYLQLPSGYAFPLVVTKGVRLDRAYAAGVPIEVYYPSDMASRIKSHVATAASQLTQQLNKKLGKFPFPKLMVVAQESRCSLDGIREIIGIGKDESGGRLLYPYMASSIAGCWFGDRMCGGVRPASVANPCALASGVAAYVAMREIADSLGTGPMGSLNALRKFAPVCASDDLLPPGCFTTVYYRVPWEMRMLRFMIGDSLLWKSIRTYGKWFQTQYPSTSDFESIVAENAGKNYDWFFKQWQQPNARLDYYVDGVEFKEDDSGVTVYGRVINDGNVFMPVELAFTTRPGDTLFDKLSYADFDRETGEADFSVHLRHRPRVILVDPHHFLPDENRNNSYWRRFERGQFYRDLSLPIPGIRN